MHSADDPCHTLAVPATACYLRFSDDRVQDTHHAGTTTRGEMFIIDFDAEGRIVGVELVGTGKPCQQS
jgi:hypothetical protein